MLITENGAGAERHHLGDEVLLDYASGSAGEALSLICAVHLTQCPRCRASLSRHEALGGALLDTMPPAEIAPDACERALAGIDLPAQPIPPARASSPDGTVPAPLRAYLQGGLDDLPWRRLLPGFHEYRLPMAHPTITARLLRLRPGRSLPRHTHRGSEATCVIQGAYADRLGHYAEGDVAFAGADVEHQPTAMAGPDCICLVVSDAPLRLTGTFGRLLNPLLRF